MKTKDGMFSACQDVILIKFSRKNLHEEVEIVLSSIKSRELSKNLSHLSSPGPALRE